VIGMNPITTENNTVITLHLDDEEHVVSDLVSMVSSIEMTPGPPSGCPHTVKCKVGLHELIVLPSKLLEHGVRHQVHGSAAVE
jgi:hypothetical protein